MGTPLSFSSLSPSLSVSFFISISSSSSKLSLSRLKLFWGKLRFGVWVTPLVSFLFVLFRILPTSSHSPEGTLVLFFSALCGCLVSPFLPKFVLTSLLSDWTLYVPFSSPGGCLGDTVFPSMVFSWLPGSTLNGGNLPVSRRLWIVRICVSVKVLGGSGLGMSFSSLPSLFPLPVAITLKCVCNTVESSWILNPNKLSVLRCTSCLALGRLVVLIFRAKPSISMAQYHVSVSTVKSKVTPFSDRSSCTLPSSTIHGHPVKTTEAPASSHCLLVCEPWEVVRKSGWITYWCFPCAE